VYITLVKRLLTHIIIGSTRCEAVIYTSFLYFSFTHTHYTHLNILLYTDERIFLYIYVYSIDTLSYIALTRTVTVVTLHKCYTYYFRMIL